ncbi:DNA/RNA helicase domain-containing protein [Streptomyces mirabilis]|uniref:DUF2075 domain-containing protein n=1 Tax=Streptomyces mirabilis TaxID=68239 RepID=A0ABU3V6H6_9ACTN|nr:DNA/RNA helicase domain-containing protein [Streptomyces mirabilis]MDU9001796.1 DUF2075 domain-containing protein [Streptomyces mirabilis]
MVIELKQWHTARVLDETRVQRSDGLVTTHPVQQVLTYRRFFEFWRPKSAPALDIRAAVVLHNAGPRTPGRQPERRPGRPGPARSPPAHQPPQRTTAGFCWPWTRTRPRGATTLPLDIAITVPATAIGPARTWNAAWNAADTLTAPDGTPLAPHNQLWATHTGGHQQIGCIYSAQGLEYHHSGVIIGPDLTWTDGHWTAHPDQSHDPKLRALPADQYLPYALNTYRVLLTRGTRTTRIHATDPTTRHMLAGLVHPR